MSATPLREDEVLAVRELSVVADGGQFIVGDPGTQTYVVLPEVGVQVIELLRGGATICEATTAARALAGEEVDVADFARSLTELGFANVASPSDTAEAGAASLRAGRRRAADRQAARPPAQAAASRWLRRAFSPTACAAYAACAVAAVALLALDPALFPRPLDVFFLDTPVRSIAALTLMTYLFAAAHEGAHWLAARAVGVSAKITISRRLYFLALEIDLSGLWSLPRRRRYTALLAGMAFDALVLLPVLLTRHGDAAGWWQLSDGLLRTLAAITFIEVFAIVSQCWVFLRTDLYAVLITATGCVNLLRVNELLLRRTLRRITPAQREELAGAPPRDLAVARWYRWIHLLGIGGAAWFFVAFFAPATIQLLSWISESVGHGDAGSVRFWEALAFGLVIVSPRLLTLAVALRDLRSWRVRRSLRGLGQPSPAARP